MSKANDSTPSRICYNDIIQDSIMRHAAALRHMYAGTIEDTTELAPAPLSKPLPEPLLTPLTIRSLSEPEPLPLPVWERSDKPSFDPAEAIVLPDIKHAPLLVSTALNFLLSSRVPEGLYKLCAVLPIQLLTLLLLTLHFPHITFTF